MVKKSIVKKHSRTRNGKVYKVKKHSRVRKRPLGSKITYRNVGLFQTAFDEHGNFRGSRVIKTATKKSDSLEGAKKAAIKELDTQFFQGKIDYDDYYNRLNDLLSS